MAAIGLRAFCIMDWDDFMGSQGKLRSFFNPYLGRNLRFLPGQRRRRRMVGDKVALRGNFASPRSPATLVAPISFESHNNQVHYSEQW